MKLIEKIKKILGDDIKKSGSGFYSSLNTIKKGDYFILGLNPGGDPLSNSKSIEQTLDKWEGEGKSEHNAYCDEDWGEKGKPSRLQKNLKCLFNYLETDLRTVCATNLFWERTKRENELSFASFPKYREIVELILSEVDPKVIITFGKKPFLTICSLMDYEPEISSIESGHGNWTIQLAQSKYKNKGLKIIGFPHLSIYTIYNRPEQKKKIKEFIAK